MTEDLFEKFGLEVKFGEVEVGESYPIYGMITKFIDENVETCIVEINNQIEVSMKIQEQSNLNLLKERSFEPGIFVVSITEKEPKIKGDCTTVVFGKKSQNDMQ